MKFWHVTTWMNLKEPYGQAISQTQNNKRCMLLLLWGGYISHIYREKLEGGYQSLEGCENGCRISAAEDPKSSGYCGWWKLHNKVNIFNSLNCTPEFCLKGKFYIVCVKVQFLKYDYFFLDFVKIIY